MQVVFERIARKTGIRAVGAATRFLRSASTSFLVRSLVSHMPLLCEMAFLMASFLVASTPITLGGATRVAAEDFVQNSIDAMQQRRQDLRQTQTTRAASATLRSMTFLHNVTFLHDVTILDVFPRLLSISIFLRVISLNK